MKKLLTLLTMLAVAAFISVAATLSMSDESSSSEIVWTIAGTSEILGSYWDPTDTNNDMTQEKEGVFVLAKKNVSLKAGTICQFKVVGNHSWDINYGADGIAGGDNITFEIDQTGVYNVWFYFYPNDGCQLYYGYEMVSGGQEREWKTDYSINYSRYSGFPFYVMSFVPEWVDGVMTDYGAYYKYAAVNDGTVEEYDGIAMTNDGVEYYRIKLGEPGWHQYFIADGIPTVAGGNYVVRASVRASEECTINVLMDWGWGSGEQVGAYVTIGTEWQEVEWEYNDVGGYNCWLVAQPGTTTATIEWKYLSVGHYDEQGQPEPERVEQLSNGDAETAWTAEQLATKFNDMENAPKICAWSKEKGVNVNDNGVWEAFPATIEQEEGTDNHVFVVHAKLADSVAEDGSSADPSSWDNQFWMQSPKAWRAGTVAKVHFRYKASQNATVRTEIHKTPSAYLSWNALGNITFTTEWQEFDGLLYFNSDMAGGMSIAFSLNAEIKEATDFYFDDLSWSVADPDEYSMVLPNPSVVVVHGQERDDLADVVENEYGDYEQRENYGGTGQIWDNQLFIVANRPLKAGERTIIEFDCSSTFEAKTSTHCYGEPGAYIHWSALGDVWFYPREEHYSTEFVVPEQADGMQSIAFNMAEIRDACDYTIKNVVWRLEDNSEWLINKTGVENFWVKEGADTAPHVYDPNAPQSTLMQETFNFEYNYSGVYFDGTQTIDGQYGKVLFAQGEGSNQPYGSYGIYFYQGNTMTLTSEFDIEKVQFSVYNWMNGYTVNTGQISDYTWRGSTSELVFTNPNSNTNRIYAITVTYREMSPEALLARLTAQIEATTAAIAGLTYAVPGKTELEALVTEASAATVETEKAQLKAYIQQLKEQTAAVVALDNHYKTLATLAAKVTTTAESNPFADATILAEATAFVQDVEAGLQACTYTAAQVTELIAKLNNYIEQLSLIYLTIHVADPGSLGDLVLEKGVEFADVAGLRVSGKLNTADQTTLKGFNNLQLVDLAETNLTTIANQQFSGKSTLKKVVLPNNTTTIGGNAFYNCYNLEEIVVPVTLQTIGEYAFYNCRALSAFYFPVGLTRIGYDAFYCNDSYYYDDDGNYVSVNGGSLKEISLPGTLVDYMGNAIGNYAFAGQKQLTKVTLAEGIDRISESVFRNCISLTDLTLPTTLTSIDSYAFAYCSALKTLELPEGLAYINNNAFRDCSALEEVILPSTLQSIYRPFYNCPNLTKMTIKAIAAPDPQSNSIMGNSSAAANVTLTVPNLSINVYKQAQYWNEFNIVGADIMPENITINTDYRLNWPEGLALDYRPNIYVASNASLWVNGNSVLSAGNFTLAYSYYNATNNSQWNSELQRYCYNRDNCFAALLNLATYARANQVNIEAYTPTNRWSFMSMPFDVKASDIALMFDETPYVIRKYDGAKRAEGKTGETWVNIGAEETIPAGQGFILQSASTDGNRNYNAFTFTAVNNEKKNDIFANDDVDVALAEYGAEFEHNRSWNLIGNPYPAYFDIRAMKTTVPITVWDNYNNNYQAYSPVDDAYILNPGQAFFMQRPINDGATVTFLKEGRQIDMEIRPLEDVANRAPMVEERSVFNLIVNGNEMGDRTRFVINNGAMMEYEAGRDANKFVSDEQSVQLYTIQNDVHFAINERPLGDAVIELGMIISKAGSYTFTLSTEVENEVYLIDRLTGMEVRLDGTEGYVFDVEQGTIEGRFAIRLGGGDVTGIKSLERDNNADNYYDLQGRKIEMPAKGVYINNGKKVVVK